MEKAKADFLFYLESDRANLQALKKQRPELAETIEDLEYTEKEINKSLRSDGYDFPREAIGGLAGEFADLYSHYLESPWTFFAFNFLTVLGHLIGDRVTLASEISPQPRLFTVCLGESADDRKSESIKRTVRFFEAALIQRSLRLCHGVGSSEGLARILNEDQRGMFERLLQEADSHRGGSHHGQGRRATGH